MAGLLTPQRQTAGNGLLDQAPRRVDDRVAGLLGLDPSIQRGAILPFGRDASGEMVMAWPEMAIDTLKSLMLPGHVMQGGEFTPRDVTEMALDVGMLSTVAPAPAGAKRMFGGISAKNAPLDDLAKAEAMEKAGEAADDIWRATGWGRGADQKWRFEIDDSGADFRDLATRPVEQYGVFGRAQEKFRHPELFGAYDLPYEIDAGRGSRRHGSASAPTHWRSDMPDRGIKAGDIQDMGRVTAKGGTRGEIKQTALHEFQHAVQNAEGFARGGNMSDEAARLAAQREAEIMATAEAALSPADQASLARYRDLATRHRGADVIPGDVVIEVNDMKKAPWFRQFQENIDEIRKMRAQAGGGAGALESGLIDREEAFRQYERLAGEVEARNVERRMDMDAATRRATPPWATEDVPRGQQIVRGLLWDSGPQMSASNENGGLLGAASAGKARAQAGGEAGINGYIYKGGQFLPNTEAPPGTWRIKRNGKAMNIPNGREFVAPGELQPRPTPFSKSVYQGLQEFTEIGQDGTLRLKDGINWEYWGDPSEKVPLQFKQLATSKDGYSIHDRIDLYNKGVRWVDLEPAPGVDIVAKDK